MDARPVAELAPDKRRALFDRDAGIAAIESDVSEIVGRVCEEGDVALREYAEEFDDITVGSLDVTDEAERAYDEIDDDLRDAIETAAANIREFHERQVPDDWRESFDGRELGRRYRPIERVGAYVPGGSAAYPSSALMTVVPANVAGVEQVSVATPPADEISLATLAALHVAGADAIYQAGGAQAIAALAYGTETLPQVQKIVGPGNRWVTAAKAAVRNDCEIDFLAGPSEVCVLADDTADARFVASDLLAQAEHDPNASVVAVTDDEALAGRIVDDIDARIEGREREDTIREALANDTSGVFHARSMSEAVLFCEEYAAEHLSIQADEGEALLDRIPSTGSVFLGPHSPVAAGDYAAGPNHVLPTGGHAKVAGGLSVDSFLRSTTVQRLDADALDAIGDTVTTLAEAEGLEAHAESVAVRLREAENADRESDRFRE